jgi:hypothetical protein
VLIKVLSAAFESGAMCPYRSSPLRARLGDLNVVGTGVQFVEDPTVPTALSVDVTARGRVHRLVALHNFVDSKTLVYACPCGESSIDPYEDSHEVQLKYEIVERDPGVRCAPAFASIGADENRLAPLAVPLMQDHSGVSATSSSHNEETTAKYIVLPGNYSGDSWACVAAMLLDPEVKVVLTMKDAEEYEEDDEDDEKEDFDDDEEMGTAPRKEKKEKKAKTSDYDDIARQFTEFARTTRGITNFEARFLVTVGGLGQQGSAGAVSAAAEKAITKDWSGKSGDPLIGWTFATTSVIMYAAERMGVRALTAKLVEAFAEPDRGYAELVRQIAGAGPCVLLNMRVGRRGNHPQHNMTATIYEQLKEQIAAARLNIVRVGTYQDPKWTPGAEWMLKLADSKGDGRLIEIFSKDARSNRKHIAYFWSEVAKLSNVRGVIGGRSGSLDIAAFMGVRTLCWDIAKRDDEGFHEYVRQLLMYPILSIARRCTPKTKKGGFYFDQKKPSPTLGIEPRDVELWLAGGNIIPAQLLRRADLRACTRLSAKVLNGREGLLLAPLEYVEGLIEESD